MVATSSTARRVTQEKVRPISTEQVPVGAGPVRKLTDADFDQLDARADAIIRDRETQLERFKTLNATVCRA